MKKIGVLRVSYELLSKILELSDDHHIINLFHEEKDKKSQTVGVVIEGPKMYDTPEASELAWTWEIPQSDGTMADIREKYDRA